MAMVQASARDRDLVTRQLWSDCSQLLSGWINDEFGWLSTSRSTVHAVQEENPYAAELCSPSSVFFFVATLTLTCSPALKRRQMGDSDSCSLVSSVNAFGVFAF